MAERERREAARWTFGVAVSALVLGAALGRAAAQPPPASPQPGDRRLVATAFFDALASGSADRFEAMARERFAPELLARRTPAERKTLLERLRNDFGQPSLGGVRIGSDGILTLPITGATGLAGRVQLGIQAAPPYRITSLAVELGEAEDGPPGPPPPPINASMTAAELGEALDAYLAQRAAADEFAGVVAIAKQGKTIFERAYGTADRERKAPVMAQTRFNVASVGKMFTKAAIGRLLSQGKLALTDSIATLLPDHPNSEARGATVEQLLGHRAGIADFFGADFQAAPKDRFASNADYYQWVARRPLLFPPGSRREYCNGCYVVLGQIVERVSGQRYEDYVAEHVFKPAGMASAGFFRSDRLPPGVAQGYSRQLPGSEGSLQNAREAHGVAGSGAGGAYASAADLLAFDNALREGRLLDPKMTAWFLERDRVEPGGRAAAGIGIAGGAPGTNALLEADEDWAVAVVGNLDPPAAMGVGLAIKRQLSR